MKQLEKCCADHQRHKTALADAETWLEETRKSLALVNRTDGSQDDLEHRLQRLKVSLIFYDSVIII